jgi:hypothetical protein
MNRSRDVRRIVALASERRMISFGLSVSDLVIRLGKYEYMMHAMSIMQEFLASLVILAHENKHCLFACNSKHDTRDSLVFEKKKN